MEEQNALKAEDEGKVTSPQHPGMALRDTLSGLGMTPPQFAKEAGLSPIQLNQILAGKRDMTADAAVRIGLFTGTEAHYWMELQTRHDLAVAEQAFEQEIATLSEPEEEAEADVQSIIAMNSEQARDFLFEPKNYCTIPLPDYFQFGPLLESVIGAMQGGALSTRGAKNEEHVNHRVMTNKDGRYAWRPLELVHPSLYVALVQEITKPEHWSVIQEKFEAFASLDGIRCLSLPIKSLNDESDKAAQIQQWHTDVEQRSIELSLDFDYLFQSDIVDCYASIYSHSIAWALHGKEEAKKRRRDHNLIGNIIDTKMQEMHFGQTNGIPQGSVLMDFIAEMVLGYADVELAERCKNDGISDYQILRYRDDYRIFVNSPPVGELILKRLTEVLIELGLQLNPAKTGFSSAVVRASIKDDKLAWIFRKQRTKNLQNSLLMIHDHGIEHPNSGRFEASLSSFHRRLHRTRRFDTPLPLIAIAVDIAVRNPRTYPHVAALLGELIRFVRDDWDKLNTIESIKRRFSNVPNSGHMDVWLQRISYHYNQYEQFAEPLCNLVNGNNTQIWNNTWINDQTISSAIEDANLIDKDRLREMGPTINPSELKLFKFSY